MTTKRPNMISIDRLLNSSYRGFDECRVYILGRVREDLVKMIQDATSLGYNMMRIEEDGIVLYRDNNELKIKISEIEGFYDRLAAALGGKTEAGCFGRVTIELQGGRDIVSKENYPRISPSLRSIYTSELEKTLDGIKVRYNIIIRASWDEPNA